MKNINKLISYMLLQFSILLCFKPKIFILAHPTHPNLGDQAQLMCIDMWLKSNYPSHKVFHLGFFTKTLNIYSPLAAVYHSILFLVSYTILKIKVSRDDVFIGHSGYFMIDHHNGWKMFVDIIRFFPRSKMIIFPQTINFHTPFIREFISENFANAKNLTLMCRDEISHNNAKILFPDTKLMLMPDIVTTLIGSKKFSNSRDGVLFCFRNDLEANYLESDLEKFIDRFSGVRKMRTDTTLDISESYMKKHRDSIIWSMIEDFAMYKVIITDRYHGTIFSLIAGTPVVVINSSDHKLSSGVNWFPESFKEYVSFAKSLNEAEILARKILMKDDYSYDLPPYFLNLYYSKLKPDLE